MEDAAERALVEVGLDKDGIQNLIERGDEFHAHVIAGIRKLSLSNQYADEKVKSNYGYLSGYTPKGIAEQVAILRELFPELKDATFDESIASQALPEGAEGWFAIPRWELIASTNGEAVQKVLDLIKQTRNDKFYNYRQDRLGPNWLRQRGRTVMMLQKLGEQQAKHDILVIPAQFGLHHRGRSVRLAREDFNASEFGLGAFAIGIMLLTHSERFQHFNDLWIDCAGEEYAPGADGQFNSAPYFFFGGDGVGFGTYQIVQAPDFCGSASAFVPQ
ncbi:MAG: hypothetical protein KJI69_02345 [Patescibacteria group bacterium]|nr:hypothetical protein [Patescibacteria group bacterium]